MVRTNTGVFLALSGSDLTLCGEVEFLIIIGLLHDPVYGSI